MHRYRCVDISICVDRWGSMLVPDIDECASATLNNCQQVCVNSEGGFTCNCLAGYSLVNSTHCEGILPE